MGFFSEIKRRISIMFHLNDVAKKFGLSAPEYTVMESAIRSWLDLYQGTDAKLASRICQEAAGLTLTEFKFNVTGSARADAIDSIIQKSMIPHITAKLETALALGGLIMRPRENAIDFILPNAYFPVAFDSSGNITSFIFVDKIQKGTNYYTRLEYNKYEQGVYTIESKGFRSTSPEMLGTQVDYTVIPEWQGIEPYISIENVDRPLFGYFKTPFSNTVDIESPLGVSLFDKAKDCCKKYDRIYNLTFVDVDKSEKFVFVDQRLLKRQQGNSKAPSRIEDYNPLPHLIRGLGFGLDQQSLYQEYNPEIRIVDYRDALKTFASEAGSLCGFDNGYFTFDENSGVAVTATQVEASNLKTVKTISNIQAAFVGCLENLVYAIDVQQDLYDLSPSGSYSIGVQIKDFTVNKEEDRARLKSLADSGYIPKWKYLVLCEGYSETEAKALVEEASKGTEEKDPDIKEDVIVEEEE